MKFFDLHTHILPCVDDGAQNITEALEMLRNAVASDVCGVVVTPHCNLSGEWNSNLTMGLATQFQMLKHAAENIQVNLFLGAEVRVTENIISLLKKRVLPTLNNSRYLLLEFEPDFKSDKFIGVLSQIISEGYVPLIAHPERYNAVYDNPFIVEDWLNIGCHIQVTGGSIMGDFGKKVKNTADCLLRNDFVCCVASDAHGTRVRSNFLSDVYSYISLYYGKHYADILMQINPQRICNDEVL